MPLLTPDKGESEQDFLDRCMADATMKDEYPDADQRRAVCQSQWDDSEESSASAASWAPVSALQLAGIRRLVCSQVWAMQPEYLEAILDVLQLRAQGVRATRAEIEQRLAAAKHGALGNGTRVSPSSGDIAVLPLMGVIAQRASMVQGMSGPSGTGLDQFLASFDAAMADESISAIVLDVDSPGGAIYGVQEAADHIAGARGTKRIIAVANAQMASAAYWLSSAADEVVATPSGEVGSIGVYTVHSDLSAAYGREGVKQTVIKAGKYKAEGRLLSGKNHG